MKVYENTYALAGISCGQGNGAVSTPVATTPTMIGTSQRRTNLPATLPQTGAADNGRNLLLTLLAGIITYGAVFFAQSKRS